MMLQIKPINQTAYKVYADKEYLFSSPNVWKS